MNVEEKFLYEAFKNGQINFSGLNKEHSEKLVSFLSTLAVKKARDDFYTYVRLMADEIIPTGFKDGRHIRLICKELQEVEQSIVDVYEGRQTLTKREQFFLPPGAMKSLLISVLFSSWFLGRHPKWRVLQLGHTTAFAIDNFGRKVKDLISDSEKFKHIFPECKLKVDTRSAQRFELTLGGGYYCAGAGSSIAGRRAHLLICDDVLDEQTAFSDVERTKIVKWYIPGARSRLLPNSSEIIVNTRWHVEDLSAFLEKIDGLGKNPWHVISIPAILDDNGAKLLGLKPKESFWPEFYSTDYFNGIKDSYVSSGEISKWFALYLQTPVQDEGNIVKREMIKYWDDEEPNCDFIIASVDTAFETTKRADFSAITVWGVFKNTVSDGRGREYTKNNIILLDAKQGKWELPELIDQLHEVQDVYSPNWFLIERKASGISVLQELRRNPKFHIYEIVPDKDKMTRLQAALPTFKQGSVWFPRGDDIDYCLPVIEQLLQFPAGKKDFVDTVSQLINWMRLNMVLVNSGEYGDDEDDDREYDDSAPKSYWGALQRRH